MFKDKTIKKGIIASIIATLIFIIVLEPIMKLLWLYLNKAGISIYSRYLDYVYKSAALGHRNDIDVMLITFVLVAMMGLMVGAIIINFIRKRETKSDLDLNDNLENNKNLIKKKIEKLHKRSQILEKLSNRLYKVMVISVPIFIILGFLGIFQFFIDLQLNTTFNQRVNAIGPYIDDTQKETLVSKWALMTSKDDYVQINLIIENIARDNNIELPNALIK